MKKIIHYVKHFVNALLSDAGEISSKRFTLISSIILIATMVIANVCGQTIDSTIFVSTIGLAAAAAGLTVVEKVFNK